MELTRIKKKLEELNIKVYYGSAEKNSEKLHEYIVFGRDSRKFNNTKMSTTDYYDIAVISENWIAEGFIDQVINTLEDIGLRKSDDDIDFKYAVKNDISYEIASIKFYDTVGRTRWHE